MSTQTLTTYQNMISLGAIPEGGQVANTLEQRQPILMDIGVKEGSDTLGHTGGSVTSLPQSTIRKVGGFKSPVAGTVTPFHEDMAIHEIVSAVPDDVKRLHGMSKVMQMEQLNLQGFLQGVTEHWLSGTSATAPEKTDGLLTRLNTPDNNTGSNSFIDPDTSVGAQKNVLSAGGTGSNTMSILFIKPGPGQVEIITPKNDPQYGYQDLDKGMVEEPDVSTQGSYRDVWRREWMWTHGILVENYNCIGRIRNIPSAMDSMDPNVIRLIYQLLEEGMWQGSGPVFMYVPPRMKTFFMVMLESKSNVRWSTDNPYDTKLLTFGENTIIRTLDRLTITETAVDPV